MPLQMRRRIAVVGNDGNATTGDNDINGNGTMGDKLDDDGNNTIGDDIDDDCNGATGYNDKDNGD